MTGEPRAVWPGTEPCRSLLGLIADLVQRVGAVGVEGTVWARRHGTDWWIASSGERADRCDRLADGMDGPRRAALASGQAVVVPDVVVDGDWPGWRAVTRAAGLRSALALPADLDRGGRSVLCLYGREPGPWAPEDLHRATALARQVGSLVDLHSTIPAQSRRVPEPVERRRSALAVEQAVGVLMERRSCDEPEAREVLATTAEAHGTTLAELAAAVLRREQHEGPAAHPALPRTGAASGTEPPR